MKLKVNLEGVLIPKEYLKDIEEVEVRRDNGFILVIPITKRDPILDLGSDPVDLGVSDASLRHDSYLYEA